MRVIFPDKFGDDSANFYYQLARKTRLLCQEIMHGKSPETSEEINLIDRWQIEQSLPKNFDSTDPDNYIKRIELSLESLCTSMEELGVNRPQELTLFQFYTKLIYFEKKKLKQKK